MKKVACFASDSKLLERVNDFCEVEGFELVDCSDGSIEQDIAIIVLLTDNLDVVKSLDVKSIAVCYVGSEKSDVCPYFLSENFSNTQLRCLVDAICHNSVFDQALNSVSPLAIKKELVVENDIYNVEKMVFSLTRDFIYFFSFNMLEKIRVGLAEMITNAIEHGNLGITGSEKKNTTEAGTYYDLVNERLAAEPYCNRKTVFEFDLNDKTLFIRITDEGAGFDVSSLPDPTDFDALLNLHGRGILITRMYFDKVEYNDKGNEVRLYKRFK